MVSNSRFILFVLRCFCHRWEYHGTEFLFGKKRGKDWAGSVKMAVVRRDCDIAGGEGGFKCIQRAHLSLSRSSCEGHSGGVLMALALRIVVVHSFFSAVS